MTQPSIPFDPRTTREYRELGFKIVTCPVCGKDNAEEEQIEKECCETAETAEEEVATEEVSKPAKARISSGKLAVIYIAVLAVVAVLVFFVFIVPVMYAFRDTPLPISVKTRLGLEKREEFPAILEALNRYPIKELTVHPRVRKQFYNGDVDMQAFFYAVENSKNPLCYNGNLCSLSQISAFQEKFPSVGAVMLGRGLIADPGMLTPGGTQADVLEAFLGELLAEYVENFGGPKNAMFRMKEQWGMVLGRFDCGEKLKKRLRKTTDLAEYRQIVKEIFQTLTAEK